MTRQQPPTKPKSAFAYKGPKWHEFCGAQVRIEKGRIIMARRLIGDSILRWACGVGDFRT